VPAKKKARISAGLLKLFHFGVDVVFEPPGIPPFNWLDRCATNNDTIVEVIATGKACGTCVADRFAPGDGVTLLNIDGAEMGIKGLETKAVINNHDISINAKEVGVDDGAVVARRYWRMLGRSQVQTEVGLVVYLFAFVHVVACIGEPGTVGRIGQTFEHALPQFGWRCVATELQELVAVRLSNLIVDEEVLFQRCLLVWHIILELRDSPLHEAVRKIDLVPAKFAGIGVEVECSLSGVACFVAGYDDRLEILDGNVPGVGEHAIVQVLVTV